MRLGVCAVLGATEDVETQFGGDVCVVRLRGDLRGASAATIRRLVDRISDSFPSSVLIDASLLGAINEECASAIAALGQAIRRVGGTISAYGASGPAAAIRSSIDG
jgi:anti-anti-sigma regulatory factor